MAQSPKWLLEIIKRESFMKYHAYYKTVQHNHKPQGIIAYARLCNSPEMVEKYAKSLEGLIAVYDPDAELTTPHEIDYIKSSKLEDYLGKAIAFYKVHGFFQEMYKNKYNGNITEMIKDVCPPIVDGPLYGAFHGVIQMAYGMACGSDEMVVEGIGYMYHQYSPMYIDDINNPKRTDLTPFGKGTVSFEDTIKKLQDEKLVNALHEENKRDVPLKKDLNINGVFGWSAVKYHSDFFMDLTNDVKLPEWFVPEQKDMEQLKKILGWFMDIAAMVYVKSSVVNDFFILHGITGSWSSRKVLPLLDYDSALLAFRAALAQFFMLYVEQDAPALSKNPEDFYQGDINQGAWDKLISEVVNDEDFYEFHIYKVIQCLYERWQENPDSEFAKFHFAGACVAKDSGYTKNKKSNKMTDHM